MRVDTPPRRANSPMFIMTPSLSWLTPCQLQQEARRRICAGLLGVVGLLLPGWKEGLEGAGDVDDGSARKAQRRERPGPGRCAGGGEAGDQRRRRGRRF